ncbi:hypothetical protein QL285_092516 [Trifolium repens]|nr:hypothetical protein QL285_092516 [Trifolium repens]
MLLHKRRNRPSTHALMNIIANFSIEREVQMLHNIKCFHKWNTQSIVCPITNTRITTHQPHRVIKNNLHITIYTDPNRSLDVMPNGIIVAQETISEMQAQ